MSGRVFAILTVLGMAAFTLLLRATMDVWPVGTAGSLSRAVALAVLGAWVLARGRGWRRLATSGLGGWIVLMGVISTGINLLLFASLEWTTATNNALLFRLDLVFVLFIGSFLGLERITPAELLLLPVMLLGVALVVVNPKELSFRGHTVGDVMVVVAALGFAVNAFVILRILRRMDEEAVALYNHGISTLGFVVLMLAGGELSGVGETVRSPAAWSWIVLLGVVSAVVLPLYYAALHRMQVWRLRTWLLATPVMVAVAEWLLWGTRLSGTQLEGGVLVLAGLGGLIHLEIRARNAREENVP